METAASSTVMSALNETLNREIVSLTSRVISSSCNNSHSSTNKFASIVLVTGLFATQDKVYFHTGSTAEFYIRPVIPCTGDVDVMYYNADAIVVGSENPKFPPMTNKRFGDLVDCYGMESCDSHPGFVRLKNVGRFRYNWEREEYVFHKDQSETGNYRKHSTYDPQQNQFSEVERSGPALSLLPKPMDVAGIEHMLPADVFRENGIHAPLDMVLSYPCHFWPVQASEWETRDRRHGCPDPGLIRDIVSKTCDVVEVAPADCRQDDGLLRLSFSRAEVDLIKSWSHAQQVVYHMVRYFAKEELIQKKCEREDRILCTYHVKTIMLWTIETFDKTFWDSHVVDICCSLLNTLRDRLKEKKCPNYFVITCNLFAHIRNERNLREVIAILENFQDNRNLAYWFLKNYIERSAVLLAMMSAETFGFAFPNSVGFQEYISSAFGLTMDPENIVPSYWKQQEKIDFSYSIMLFSHNLKTFSFSAEGFHHTRQIPCLGRMDAFAVGKRFAEYITAIQPLHLSKQLVCLAIPFDGHEIFDYVGRLYKQFEVHSFPLTYSQHLSNSRLYFIRAQELMSGLQGELSSVEVQLLQKLSIACIQKSLSYHDPDKDISYCSAAIYLAALFYSAGEYSRAAVLCRDILRPTEENEDRNRKGRNYNEVSGRLVLFIDEVANIFGFLILLRYAKVGSTTVVCRMREIHFTNRAFARTLMILCSSENSRESAVPTEQEMNVADQCLDLLVTSLHRRKKPKLVEFIIAEETRCFHSEGPLITATCCSITKEELTRSLMDAYFANLTRTYESVRNDSGPECNSDVLLRALYLYRCKQYDEVLLLCARLENSSSAFYHTQLCTVCNDTLSMAFAGPADLFLDDDIQFVHGLGQLLKACCGRSPFLVYADSGNPNLPPNYLQYEKRIEESFWKNEKTSMQRRFLARYLRLRCFVDMNCPTRDVLDAYRQLENEIKNSFPMDRIILVFIRQKIRRFLRKRRCHDISQCNKRNDRV